MKANHFSGTSMASACRVLVVGLVSHAALALSTAAAEDLQGHGGLAASAADAAPLNLELSERAAPGFMNIAPGRASGGEAQGPRRYGFVLTANGGAVGIEVEPHVTLGSDASGDISHQGRGFQARLGGALADLRNAGAQAGASSSWYVFAGADDEALTWRPGAGGAASGSDTAFALQNRVEIGDVQAGVTLETRGVQASLAYVEREVSTRVGARTVTQDENFAGLTLTMRR